MKSIIIVLAIVCGIGFNAQAQKDGNFHQGEFGVSFGLANYFGDLNTRSGLNEPKPSAGLFFRKQFGNYVGMRVSARYAQLGYSDKYSKNLYQKTRNLDFKSDIFEFVVQGDFNFFTYDPKDLNYLFTPYVTLGIGVFSFNPYTFTDAGEKTYLSPLLTEGQNTQYNTMALCVPFGVGFKYSISPKTNLNFEIVHRFTTTDYLDDVSTQYAGLYLPDGSRNPNFWEPDPNNQTAYILSAAGQLQDRSEGQILGTKGRQRGWSKQKDQYIMAEIGLSFNISTYRCPTAY